MSTPNRGEVWLVDLGLAAKVRPCVIVSIPALDTERALATAVAHTTSPRGTQFEVGVSVSFLRPGVFDVQNLVTIPHAKYLRKLRTLTSSQLQHIENPLRRWLGLS